MLKKKKKKKVGLGTEGYEIDPTKLSGTETVKGNAANVIARVEELLSRLVASVDKLPREIAHVCWLLSENVCAKMPAAKYVGIGGFLMLRFILPGEKNVFSPLFFFCNARNSAGSWNSRSSFCSCRASSRFGADFESNDQFGERC